MLIVKDCVAAWNNCLRLIKQNVGEQSFKTWFEPILPLSLQNNVLTIQVPSQFFYEWLEENYVLLLKQAIDSELGTDGRLEYSIIVDKKEESKTQASTPRQSNATNGQAAPANNNGWNKNINGNGSSTTYTNPFDLRSLDRYSSNHSQLNPNYTFDTFIEGDCNRLARSAGFAVSEKPGITSFNPLMIYGGVGLGKTHLVQAIGNHIKQNLPNKFVLYVSSEKFSNQFIEAISNNKLQDFNHFYLQVDVLIIDDIQFFSGKEKTQDIFFQIFNHLHQSGKQLIMTSDRSPKELKGLQERLLSRFKWGLTAD